MEQLTKKRLEAMEEALNIRLAGELDRFLTREDYEMALKWVQQQLSLRALKTGR